MEAASVPASVATLLAAGAAAVLLIAPTAYHRILFRLGDKEHLVIVANRFTLAGLTCVALAVVGAVLLVTDLLFEAVAVVVATTTLAALGWGVFWCLAPLLRRASVCGQGTAPGASTRARGGRYAGAQERGDSRGGARMTQVDAGRDGRQPVGAGVSAGRRWQT
jgi:Family of unknown function (DUF6328)